jgi:hypothetical protein
MFPKARIVPIHYDGWTHFSEARVDVERAVDPGRLLWLERGVPREI